MAEEFDVPEDPEIPADEEEPPKKKCGRQTNETPASKHASPSRRVTGKRKQAEESPAPARKPKAKAKSKAADKSKASAKATCKAKAKGPGLHIKHAKEEMEESLPLTFARRYRPPKDSWSQRLWDGCLKAFRRIIEPRMKPGQKTKLEALLCTTLHA